MCIVTEFMPKGSLFDVLHDERYLKILSPTYNILTLPRVDLPWERRLSMAKDTAKGLTFLHCSDPPTLHNDLKSQNLLVSHNWVCKVSDFGLTSLKGARTQVIIFFPFPLTVSSPSRFRTSFQGVYIGWHLKVSKAFSWSFKLIYFLVLNNEPSTEKSDVYSFGGITLFFSDLFFFELSSVILWELAARAEPYEGMSWAAVRVGVLKRKQRPIMPKNLDPEYQQVRQKLKL